MMAPARYSVCFAPLVGIIGSAGCRGVKAADSCLEKARTAN